MHFLTVIEYIGSAFGMIGAVANSFGIRWARVTWPSWTVSAVLLIACTGLRHEWGIFSMQCFYLLTTLNGLRLLPRRTQFASRASSSTQDVRSSQEAPVLVTRE